MREEVKAFVASVAARLEPTGPVVEIGALQTPGQEGYADLRPLFPGREYLGVDLVEGPGVDRIEDVRALRFADASIGTLVAVDSLEHVADPHHAVSELHRVLAPGGTLLVGTPFIFPVHHHPDFTRFTPEGMARLLSAFPQVAVFSIGDAQWPHSIVAVAGTHADGARFDAAMARVAAEWDVGVDALVAFAPVESIIRQHDVSPRGDWLRPGAPRDEVFVCPADGLARIDVRVSAAAEIPHGTVHVSLHPEHADAPAVAEQAIPPRGLGEPQWKAFQFTPLAGSAGRRYVLRLRVDEGAVITYTRQQGDLMFEAYRRRALVPPPPVPTDDAPRLARRVEGLTAELAGLERQVAALRAQLAAERAVPWWRRLFARPPSA